MNDIFDKLENNTKRKKTNKKVYIRDNDSDIIEHIIISTTEEW